MSASSAPTSRWRQYERQLVLACLVGICLLAWLALLQLRSHPAMAMASMDMGGLLMAPSAPQTWDAATFALMLGMWVVMMTGMMLPSALPMLLLYHTVLSHTEQRAYRETAVFAAAYLVIWSGFSIAATALQWLLEQLALLSPMLSSSSTVFAGSLLVLAGAYQCLPFKQRCLTHCRSPLHFVTHHWRAGPAGAWQMGVQHGLYCLGCCWMLMGLLFVFGLMNLLWIGTLSALILLEKLLPHGIWFSRLNGGLLLLWGVYMLLSGHIGPAILIG